MLSLSFGITTLVLAFAVMGLVILGILFLKKRSNDKAVEGKVLVEQFRRNGTKRRSLAKFDWKEVMNPWDDVPEEEKTLAIDKDRVWYDKWPLGASKFLQVTVPTVSYFEGNPEPITEGEAPVLTDETLHMLSNERMGRNMFDAVRNMDVPWGDEDKRRGSPVTGKQIGIILGIAGVGVLVFLIMKYSGYI